MTNTPKADRVTGPPTVTMKCDVPGCTRPPVGPYHSSSYALEALAAHRAAQHSTQTTA